MSKLKGNISKEGGNFEREVKVGR